MHLEKLAPLLVVDDIDATIAFYHDVLEFELIFAVPGGGRVDWALMRCGYVDIMFQARAGIPEGQRPCAWTGITLHFEGEGVSKLYEKIKDSAQIVRHLAPTLSGTREFTLRDCNGHLLSFAEPVSAINEQ